MVDNLTYFAQSGSMNGKTLNKKIFSELGKPLLILVIVSGLVAGFISQLNWINTHCKELPFFQNGARPCEENQLRLVLGPPLITLIFIGLFILMSRLYVKYNPNAVVSTIVKKIAITFGFFTLGLFTLWALLPVLKYNQSVLYISVLLALLNPLIGLRKETRSVFRHFFPKPTGDAHIKHKKNKLTISLEGTLSGITAERLFDKMTWSLTEYEAIEVIEINVDQLNEVNQKAIGILFLIVSHSLRMGSSYTIIGDDKMVKELNKAMKVEVK